MAPPELFLSLVQEAARTRGGLDPEVYLAPALNVARRIPDEMNAADAATMFIRWIFNEPFDGKDAALWLKLMPHL
jgi:hypothetical protein